MTAGALDEGEVIRRLRTIDLDTLARTSYWLRRGGDLMADAATDVVCLLEQAAEFWQSDDATAALEELRTCQDGLIRGSVAFEEMAAALDRVPPVVDEARMELLIFDRAVADAYRDPGSALQGVDEARTHLERAEGLYHDAERVVRTLLWDLGDSAPVGGAPVPLLPITPKQSWWERLLFGAPGFYAWRKGPDGRLVGFDEDGEMVPGHRGHAEFVEVEQGGFGGLLQRIPGLGRRMRLGPRASLKDLTEAFADDIVKAKSWTKPEHVPRHIREWFHLPPEVRPGVPTPIPAWMEKEFIRLVATAVARSGKVIRWKLKSGPTHAVLHYDQATKRYLVVHFHATGPLAGEFATAFIPSAKQLDEFLRRAATVKGI